MEEKRSRDAAAPHAGRDEVGLKAFQDWALPPVFSPWLSESEGWCFLRLANDSTCGVSPVALAAASFSRFIAS